MSRDITPFALRMPPELRAKAEAAANDKGRSLNAELLARIAASFESRPMTADEASSLFGDLALEIRTIEGGLNKGFNQLAATVYRLAHQIEQISQPPIQTEPSPYSDIKISDLSDYDPEDGISLEDVAPTVKRVMRSRTKKS